MSFTNRVMEIFAVSAANSIETSQNIPEIRDSIVEYGYGPVIIQEGRDMHTEFHGSVQEQVQMRQEVRAQNILTRSAFGTAYSSYLELVDMLRTHLSRDRATAFILGLPGQRERKPQAFITQATYFYKTLIGNDTVFNRITKYQLTREKLQAAFDLVIDYQEEFRKKEDANGAMQRATAKRNENFANFFKWVREFEKACRAALKDRPQLIERLGFSDLHNLRAKKKPVEPEEPSNPEENPPES
jgi:hypothetical protein